MEATSKPKVSKQEAAAELWRRAHLQFKLDRNQKDLYRLFHNSDHKIQVWLLSRRCLAEGTLIKTPQGLKKIEDLKVGDQVYGYTENNTIEIANIKEVFNNGPKEVVDLCNNGRVLETTTLNHKFLTVNEYNGKYVEREVKDIKGYNKIVRQWVEIDDSFGINEPHAYAIGALLGDGCSRQGVNKIYISSEDDIIPKKVAEILNCQFYSSSELNYTWCLSENTKGINRYRSRQKNKLKCNYYWEWCAGKYAHEKYADLDVIKKWNKSSQLAFLAGIIDTEGSFSVTKDNCLMYSIGMQSLSIIEACQYIIHNIFQYKPNIHIDNQEKYKNGPIYSIKVKNNFICKKLLRGLNPFIQLERKNWKPDYEMFLENNTNPSYVGITIKNPRIMNTYDIHIDNKTNLYLTSNGLVTHNSGKTHTLLVLAFELLLRKPRAIVKFVAPTRLQVQTIIRPLIQKIISDCPPELHPSFKTQDYTYYFPNGSELQLAGSESQNAEKLRGGECDIAIIDEAQDVSDLNNIIKSILLPTTLTTKGKILMAGTPPKDMDHEFIHYIEDAEAKGALIKRTIYDNPRITRKDIQTEILDHYPEKEQAEEFRREFLCQLIKNESTSVVPEFTEVMEAAVVRDWPKPVYYDAYVAMDLGAVDLTAILFAYYDFRNHKIIVEDEIVMDFSKKDASISHLVELVQKKEAELWTNPLTLEVKKPYLRVSDINPIVIQEISMASFGKVNFITTKKDDKEAAINNMRSLVGGFKIIIHPRCVNLIRHLKNVKWSSQKNKLTFARSPDNGHYDFVDALIYLCRNVQINKNPYPANYDLTSSGGSLFVPKAAKKETSTASTIYKMFNIKGKK